MRHEQKLMGHDNVNHSLSSKSMRDPRTPETPSSIAYAHDIIARAIMRAAAWPVSGLPLSPAVPVPWPSDTSLGK